MAKFKVKVKVKAEYEYEAEVEAEYEHEADKAGFALWREKMPEDFRVSKDYVTEIDVEDTERLTYVCEDCGREYPAEANIVSLLNGAAGPLPLMPWCGSSDYCRECGEKMEAEEEAMQSTCAAMSTGGIHSESFYDGFRCQWCGERPRKAQEAA